MKKANTMKVCRQMQKRMMPYKKVCRKLVAVGLIMIAIVFWHQFQPRYVSFPDYDTSLVLYASQNEVTASVKRLPDGRYDWQEYNFQITNHAAYAIDEVTLVISMQGEVRAFQVWGMDAETVGAQIIIHFKQNLQSGETFQCAEGQKFGYSGGALPQNVTVKAKQ